MNGFGEGSSDRLIAHGQQSDPQSQSPCQQEGIRSHIRAVGKIFQPLFHEKVSDRTSDYKGQSHKFDKILHKQNDDVRYGRTHNLSDTDLLGALLRRESSQPEQAETTDQDSENREHPGYLPGFLFGIVLSGQVVIQEGIIEGLAPCELVPLSFEKRQGSGDVFRLDTDRQKTCPIPRNADVNDRAYFMV